MAAQMVAKHDAQGHEAAANDKITFGFWVYLMTDLLMFAVLFAAAVGARRFVTLAGGVRALAALVDLLEFVFHLGQASPQLGVFRLEFGDPFSKLLSVVHDDRIMRENQKQGKRNCLTVTGRR